MKVLTLRNKRTLGGGVETAPRDGKAIPLTSGLILLEFKGMGESVHI